MGAGEAGTILKFTDAPAHHEEGLAVMVPGVGGVPEMLSVLVPLLPGEHKEVFATTLTCPLVKVEDTLNWIALLPCPEVIVVPAGFVQV